MRYFLLPLSFLCCFGNLYCQPTYTANDVVPPYTKPFGYGSNMGYNPPHYMDEQLATLVAGTPDGKVPGVGVTTIRPALPENFLHQWGYDIRKSTFSTYETLGLTENVVFVGFPSEDARDPTSYCVEGLSESFKGLYDSIWDNGANGTPVNDNNLYALYIWKTVNAYKGQVRFWEIMNEPDLDNKGNAWKSSDMPGNWWTGTPNPCEYKFRAPIYHYVRMMRISYEVIKEADPTAYVCIGGIGYPSFLDLVCRFTDNPDLGKVTPEYPLLGGAYFDVLSFHSYPHLDNSLRSWDLTRNGFRYFRHSDAAVQGVWDLRDKFAFILKKYGYDGNKYPSKHWIMTEVNIPRKQYGDYIGSDDAQNNFMMKTLISAQREGLLQMHVYNLSDEKKLKDAVGEFNFMGLFENLDGIKPYEGAMSKMAIGFKSTSENLKGKKYDADRSAELNLPDHIDGAAFRDANGYFTYVLWAKTALDRSEDASAEYAFPDALNVKYLIRKDWRSSISGRYHLVNGRQVTLDGCPAFFSETDISTNQYPKEARVFPNPTDSSGESVLSMWIFEPIPLTVRVFDAQGALVKTILQNKIMVAGAHQLMLHLGDLAQGVYFIRIEGGEEVKNTLKIVKG